MVVYRIEHPEHGLGPYSAEGCYLAIRVGNKLINAHCGSDEHPSPRIDNLSKFLAKYENALFACPDMVTLRAWFDSFWGELMQAGYRVEIYRVKDYKIGKSGKQVAFDPATAKKL